MATLKRKTKTVVNKDLELRKWCIEQACRTPLTENYHGLASSYPSSAKTTYINVTHRANEIYNWVRGV